LQADGAAMQDRARFVKDGSMTGFACPVTHADGVARIDLGRPDAGNSLTRGMMRDLAALASRPRLVLERIKKFTTHAQDMSAAQQSEYAGTLLALVRA